LEKKVGRRDSLFRCQQFERQGSFHASRWKEEGMTRGKG